MFSVRRHQFNLMKRKVLTGICKSFGWFVHVPTEDTEVKHRRR